MLVNLVADYRVDVCLDRTRDSVRGVGVMWRENLEVEVHQVEMWRVHEV